MWNCNDYSWINIVPQDAPHACDELQENAVPTKVWGDIIFDNATFNMNASPKESEMIEEKNNYDDWFKQGECSNDELNQNYENDFRD